MQTASCRHCLLCFLFQLLNLLDVIIDNAESKSSSSSDESVTEHLSGQISTADGEINTGSGGTTSSGSEIRSSKAEDSKPSASGANREFETQNVLLNLPQAELRLLCSLLAREGYVGIL